MALSSVLLALTAGCDTSGSAGAWQLSRAEMMAIAQDNSARIQHALAAHDVGVYMANKARCLTLFVPLRGERSYAEDYGGMCELLSPLLDGSIARLQEWPYRIYIGNNTATYLLTSMYECENGITSDNELIISLRVRPSDHKITEMYVMYWADRMHRLLALCRGDPYIPDERPHRAFVKELEGADAVLGFWERTDPLAQRDASYIFDRSVVACFSFLPLSACTRGKEQLLRAAAEYNVEGGALLSRRSVLHNNIAWLSLTLHLRCVDGRRVAIDWEQILFFDFSGWTVTRLYMVADEFDVSRFLQCTRGDRTLPPMGMAELVPHWPWAPTLGSANVAATAGKAAAGARRAAWDAWAAAMGGTLAVASVAGAALLVSRAAARARRGARAAGEPLLRRAPSRGDAPPQTVSA